MIKTQALQLLNVIQSRGVSSLTSNSLKQMYKVGTIIIHQRGLHQTDIKRCRAKDPKDKSKDVDSELQEAAVNVAKSLPGDWTKTADELLSRLNINQAPQEDQTQNDITSLREGSLLKTMGVGREYTRSVDQRRKGHEDRRQDAKSVRTSDTRERMRKDSNFSRRQIDVQQGLFSRKRLGIFDAKAVKSSENLPKPTLGMGLWEFEDLEKLNLAMGGPKNEFEEQIEMTRRGQLWTFPVDNEADLHEERQYKFTDHIFLDKHLSQFPRQGPIRQFMELVCVGLGKNPHWSVPEKIEHIQWFAEFFKGKQSIIDKNLEEKHKMVDN